MPLILLLLIYLFFLLLLPASASSSASPEKYSLRLLLERAGGTEKMALEMTSADSMAELRAEVTQWWKQIHPASDTPPPFRILAQGKEIGTGPLPKKREKEREPSVVKYIRMKTTVCDVTCEKKNDYCELRDDDDDDAENDRIGYLDLSPGYDSDDKTLREIGFKDNQIQEKVYVSISNPANRAGEKRPS